jgi:AcrR family transcriptional regulator
MIKPAENRKPPAKRKRGRPPKPSSPEESTRETILNATRFVYADYGFRSFSVELLLKEAGISRPTFYRHFKDKYEAIDIVVERANVLLFNSVEENMNSGQTLQEVVDKGVDAYFNWGLEIGKLAGPIYREIHDPESPSSVHRNSNVKKLAAALQAIVERNGQHYDASVYSALIHVVEHVGHSAFWPETVGKKDIQRLKDTALLILYRTLQIE